MKLLHIGLCKCGSTFLQNEIFPRIAKKLNINFINLYKNNYFNIVKRKVIFNDFENFKNIENLLPNDFIISNERLFSRNWEFSRIEKNFKYIKNNFSSDTVILIIIRNPYNLLNSIYCQTIHNMKIVRPENFFYIDDDEKNIGLNNKYNLYNIDYSKLISFYKNHFKKVVVVKYENLQNLDFLKDIFNFNDDYIKELRGHTNTIYNKSISKFGINFILFFNNFFNVKKYNDNIKKYNELITNHIKPSDKIIDKIKNRMLSQFILREIRVFFQDKFDKILPYKKYKIKKNYIPIDIDSEIKKYDFLEF